MVALESLAPGLVYAFESGIDSNSISRPRAKNRSIENALKSVEEKNGPLARDNYRAVYDWFMERSGTEGSREYGEGQRLPGVTPEFAHAAQRGIHVPSRQYYALTVTCRMGTIYSQGGADGVKVDLPDGTWLMSYDSHRNNTGGKTDSTWNDGLYCCFRDGVPVGVFLQTGNSTYYRALAFVESFDFESGVFTLHGPVESLADPRFMDASGASADEGLELLTLSKLTEDRRKRVLRETAIREGQELFRSSLISAYEGKCAITECDIDGVLQAAHVVNFMGPQSNIVPNGMLLRSDLHLLYDKNLLAIDPDSYRIVLSPVIESSIHYKGYAGEKLRLPKSISLAPNRELLALHFDAFVRKCEKLAG